MKKCIILTLLIALLSSNLTAFAIIKNCDMLSDADYEATKDKVIVREMAGTDVKKEYKGSDIAEHVKYISDIRSGKIEGPVEENLPAICPELDKYYNFKQGEFFVWLTNHFQSPNSTSSLSNTAIKRYHKYTNELNVLCGMAEKVPVAAAESEEAQLTLIIERAVEYISCRDIMNDYISVGKDRMMAYMKSTSALKKATLLAEKYKAINSKLMELNLKIAMMSAFYETIVNKIIGKVKYPMIGGG